MNRIHKYRAWIKEDKQFIYFTLNDMLERHFSYYGSCDIKILKAEKTQYTGLNDKNEKEIYEGDIVELTWADKKTSIQYIVKYVEDCAYYMFECVTDEYELDALCGYSQEQFEVIGNIYENTELLEGDR